MQQKHKQESVREVNEKQVEDAPLTSKQSYIEIIQQSNEGFHEKQHQSLWHSKPIHYEKGIYKKSEQIKQKKKIPNQTLSKTQKSAKNQKAPFYKWEIASQPHNTLQKMKSIKKVGHKTEHIPHKKNEQQIQEQGMDEEQNENFPERALELSAKIIQQMQQMMNDKMEDFVIRKKYSTKWDNIQVPSILTLIFPQLKQNFRSNKQQCEFMRLNNKVKKIPFINGRYQNNDILLYKIYALMTLNNELAPRILVLTLADLNIEQSCIFSQQLNILYEVINLKEENNYTSLFPRIVYANKSILIENVIKEFTLKTQIHITLKESFRSKKQRLKNIMCNTIIKNKPQLRLSLQQSLNNLLQTNNQLVYSKQLTKIKQYNQNLVQYLSEHEELSLLGQKSQYCGLLFLQEYQQQCLNYLRQNILWKKSLTCYELLSHLTHQQFRDHKMDKINKEVYKINNNPMLLQLKKMVASRFYLKFLQIYQISNSFKCKKNSNELYIIGKTQIYEVHKIILGLESYWLCKCGLIQKINLICPHTLRVLTEQHINYALYIDDFYLNQL